MELVHEICPQRVLVASIAAHFVNNLLESVTHSARNTELKMVVSLFVHLLTQTEYEKNPTLVGCLLAGHFGLRAGDLEHYSR